MSLDAALAAVREMVAVDGGDFELVAATDTSLALNLLLEGSDCVECVMPLSFLEPVVLDVARRHMPALVSVSIADPRESQGDRTRP